MDWIVEKTDDAALIHALTQAAYAEYGHEPGTSTALKETEASVAAQLAAGTRAVVVSPLTPAGRGDNAVACVRYEIESEALYFHRLAVHPDWRRRGLATLLIARLEALARAAGRARITCSVRLEKTDNVALYQGLGYVLIGTRGVCRDGTLVPTGDLEKRLN